MTLEAIPVTLVGHPFAPIGMGEQLRSHVAAMDAVHLHHQVLDIFRHSVRVDDAFAGLVGGREARVPPGGIRIFHVNGDEVDRALAAFAAAGGRFDAGRNVIVPAWELPTYPAAWAAGLARFDEIWAISRFVQHALAAVGLSSHLIGQSLEPPVGLLLPRRWFGIRESAFVLLGFLDTTSHPARKNPEATIALFEALRAARPLCDMQLVLKVKHGEERAIGWGKRLGADPQLRVIEDVLDSLATHSLIAAADCFVSLHRSEGFGRGLGEAMAHGRLALGTAWSGNVDFMTEAATLAVPYALIPVGSEQYPHGVGQHWAEPDVATAVAMLLPYLDDPARAAALGSRARAEVLASHGNRAVGLRMLDRLEALAGDAAQPEAPP